MAVYAEGHERDLAVSKRNLDGRRGMRYAKPADRSPHSDAMGAVLVHDPQGQARFGVGFSSGMIEDPARIIGKAITEALDPARAPSKAQRLSEMSCEKRAEMERLYGRRR